MQLPQELQSAMEQEIARHPHSEIKQAAQRITEEYRSGKSSERLFSSPAARAAYLAVRMPATYAVTRRVFQEIRESQPKIFLDLGAGPGSGAWAAAESFDSLQRVELVERSQPMRELGQKLMQESPWPILQRAEWQAEHRDKEVDLALLSYLICEMKPNEIEKLLVALWKNAEMIVIIEPGTPAGFQRILAARDWAIQAGAYLIAPCPHLKNSFINEGVSSTANDGHPSVPGQINSSAYSPLKGLDCASSMPFKKCPSDWCHFPARVERTRIHKILKEGSLGYEDEKFSYLVFSKKPGNQSFARIVAAPQKAKGFIRLSLCEDGKIQEEVVSRRQEKFRRARKTEWGDAWIL